MPKLRYLDQARDDLLAIKRYIQRENGDTEIALGYVIQLRQQCRSLAEIPGKIGQSRPELRQDIRSFPHGNYIIFFGCLDGVLEIVTIIEGHRDLTALFND